MQPCRTDRMMVYGRIAVRFMYAIAGGLLGHSGLNPNMNLPAVNMGFVAAVVIFAAAVTADILIPIIERWQEREERRGKIKADELRAFFEVRK